MIKLIATDMDDTLVLTGQKHPPETFREVIEDMKNMNIYYAAASGRPYLGLKKMFEEYSDYENIIYICENGGMIVKNDKIIYRETVPKQIVKSALEYLKDFDYSAIVLTYENGVFLLDCKDDCIELLSGFFDNCRIIDEFDFSEDIMKIAIFFIDEVDQDLRKKLTEKYRQKATIRSSGINWLDIQPKDINKGTAIEKIQKKFNITYEETASFGDYYNDEEMLEKSYYSYAMKNAPDKVKSKANFITEKTAMEDAVVQEIKKLIQMQQQVHNDVNEFKK